jgi:hypothetical protein
MSNISTRHNINPFIAGKSAPLHEQRLCKVGYKNTDKSPAKYPSICVSLPVIDSDDIALNASKLIPHIRALLENAQDGIVKSLYESSQGMLTSVSDDELNIGAILGFLSAESAGDRLTKEGLEEWFKLTMADSLIIVFAEKLGFQLESLEQQVIVNKHVEVYKDMVSSLSGGKTMIAADMRTNIRKAIALCGLESDITAQKLINRLDNMDKKSKEQMSMLAL